MLMTARNLLTRVQSSIANVNVPKKRAGMTLGFKCDNSYGHVATREQVDPKYPKIRIYVCLFNTKENKSKKRV